VAGFFFDFEAVRTESSDRGPSTAVRIGSKSEIKPPTTSSDGHESRRYHEDGVGRPKFDFHAGT